MPDTIDLSIIIINWKSADFLRKCLSSIYANTGDMSYEVIVVDNASDDDSAGMVGREFPAVHFIQSEENLGFAGANNLGFHQSRGCSLLFLNPDTEVIGCAIPVMRSTLESIVNAGVVGCRLLNSDGSVDLNCIQAFPTICNQVLDTDSLRRWFPKWSIWGIRPLIENEHGAFPAEVVSGACLMIKRSVFEQVGLFSSEYFMYSDDVDLCYKVKSAGWGVFYVADSTVTHHGGRSSDRKPESNFATVMTRESLYKFMRIRRGQFHASAFRCAMAMVALCRLLMLASFAGVTLGRFKRRSLPLAFGKWGSVLRWALGRVEWVKG